MLKGVLVRSLLSVLVQVILSMHSAPALLEQLQPASMTGFELFGYDFMVDAEGKALSGLRIEMAQTWTLQRRMGCLISAASAPRGGRHKRRTELRSLPKKSLYARLLW